VAGDAVITAKALTSGVYRIHLSGTGSGEYLLSSPASGLCTAATQTTRLHPRESQTHNTEIFVNIPSRTPQLLSDPTILGTIGLDGRGGADQLTVDGVALQLAQPSTSTSLDLTLRNSAQLSLQGSPSLARLNLEDSSRAALTSGHNVLRLVR